MLDDVLAMQAVIDAMRSPYERILLSAEAAAAFRIAGAEVLDDHDARPTRPPMFFGVPFYESGGLPDDTVIFLPRVLPPEPGGVQMLFFQLPPRTSWHALIRDLKARG